MSHPATEAEKRKATDALQYLPKKQRTPARIEVTVAQQRIVDGRYGAYTPQTNRVSEAAHDMGLNKRHMQTLRELLREADEAEAAARCNMLSFYDAASPGPAPMVPEASASVPTATVEAPEAALSLAPDPSSAQAGPAAPSITKAFGASVSWYERFVVRMMSTLNGQITSKSTCTATTSLAQRHFQDGNLPTKDLAIGTRNWKRSMAFVLALLVLQHHLRKKRSGCRQTCLWLG